MSQAPTSEPTGLVADSFAIHFHDGPERYELKLVDEGVSLSFTLVQHTPRETSPGVIDVDPCGTIEIGADGFAARYSAGWEPAPYLRSVVDGALQLMSLLGRPGHVRARQPSKPN